jgi:hypothetical protein
MHPVLGNGIPGTTQHTIPAMLANVKMSGVFFKIPPFKIPAPYLEIASSFGMEKQVIGIFCSMTRFKAASKATHKA